MPDFGRLITPATNTLQLILYFIDAYNIKTVALHYNYL